MQHAWKHVERPGGSHTALDGKKKTHEYSCRNSLPAHNPCQSIYFPTLLAHEYSCRKSLPAHNPCQSVHFQTLCNVSKLMLMHKPKTSSGFTCHVKPQRIYDHAADTASLLDIRPIVVTCTRFRTLDWSLLPGISIPVATRNLLAQGRIGSNPVGLGNLILTQGANIHLG